MPPKTRADGAEQSLAEIFPQTLVLEEDKEGMEDWAVSHRTITGSRALRTKKRNVLCHRLEEENEKFTANQEVDSDDMDSLEDVVKDGVDNIKKNSKKIREAIETFSDVAKKSLRENAEFVDVHDKLNTCIEEELEVEENIVKEVRKEMKKFWHKV